VRSGLIARQDSANRKRFARFGGVVFGFDLSPLARFAAELFAASERALERRARVSALKARIAATRQRLLDEGCEDPLLEDARLACRRKLSVEELETLVEALTETLNARLTRSQPTADMSARSNENERHIQTTDKSDSVTQAGCGSSDTPALGEVLETCKEYEALMPMDRRDWPALVSVAERLVPMMGVEPPVFREARARLGEERAAAVVLCMLETLESIRKPGAFLRAMGQRAERGTFNMDGMLRAVRAKRAGMAVA
jgi:replication initiation protein RepC